MRWIWPIVALGFLAVASSSSGKSFEVIESGQIGSLKYQIRKSRNSQPQGWVFFEGQWSVIDEATGSLESIRAAIKDFADYIGADKMPSELQSKLDAAGVKFFSAAELLRIRWTSIAKELGYSGTQFVADSTVQNNLVGAAKIADELRIRYGGPLTVLNGYRPKDYNDRVSDAHSSQHILGRAIDLTASDMGRLRSVARSMYNEGKIRGLGLYVGNIHIDTRTAKQHIWGSQK